MFELVAMHVMIFITLGTSLVGMVCLLRKLEICQLQLNLRNLMYAGACCAMCFGFIGASYCLGSLVLTPWHYLAAAVMVVVGLFATAHISVDLSARLNA